MTSIDRPTSGKNTPASTASTSNMRGMRQSVGIAGVPMAPAGRRFHHMIAAETASMIIARQASSSTIWLASPQACPMWMLTPHSAAQPRPPRSDRPAS